MIIVMSPAASEEDVQRVIDRLQHDGWGTEVSRGAERTVIGVIGAGLPADYQEHFEVMPGVDSATRISKPYKLASRTFKPLDTVIEINGIPIGGGDFVVMAGPVRWSRESSDGHRRCRRLERRAVPPRAMDKPRMSPYSFQGSARRGCCSWPSGRGTRDGGDHRGDGAAGRRWCAARRRPPDRGPEHAELQLLAVGSRQPVMLKRASAPSRVAAGAEYILAQGNREVMLCERGIRTFETRPEHPRHLGHPGAEAPDLAAGRGGSEPRHRQADLVEPVALAGPRPEPTTPGGGPPDRTPPGRMDLKADPANFADMMRSLEAVVTAMGRRWCRPRQWCNVVPTAGAREVRRPRALRGRVAGPRRQIDLAPGHPAQRHRQRHSSSGKPRAGGRCTVLHCVRACARGGDRAGRPVGVHRARDRVALERASRRGGRRELRDHYPVLGDSGRTAVPDHYHRG